MSRSKTRQSERSASAATAAKQPDRAAAGSALANRYWPAFGAVILLAIVIRLIYLFDFQSSPLFNSWVGPDVSEYYQWAQQIRGGQWGWNAVPLHGPLYPFVLAIYLSLAGGSYFVTRLLQLLVGVAAMAIVMWATGRRCGRGAGLCTGLLWATYIPLIYYESNFFAESVQVLLHAIVLAILIERAGPVGIVRAGIAGLLLGLSAITHPKILIFGGLMVVWLGGQWLAGQRPRRIRALGPAAAAAVLIALPIVPVAIYNSKLAGEFILIQRHAGLNYYIGNNPQADGTPYVRLGPEWERLKTLPRRIARKTSESDRQAFYVSAARRFIWENPVRWLSLCGCKLLLTFNAREVTASAPLETVRPDIWLLRIPTPGFGFLFAAGCVGLVFAGAWRLTPAWLLVVASTAGCVMYVAAGRYRVDMLPGMFVLAGPGLSYMGRLFGELKRSATPSAARAELVRVGLVAAGAFGVAWLPVVPAWNDDPAEAAVVRATALIDARAMPAAVRELEEAVRIRPDYAAAHVVLGDLLAQEGDVEAALQSLQRAADLDPFPIGLEKLGNLQTRRGALDEALAAYARALELDPDQTGIRVRLAETMLRAGQPEEAAGQFETVLQMNPGLGAASFGLAGAYRSLNREGDAARVLITGLERNPGDVALLLRLALIRSASANAELRDPAAGLRLARQAADLAQGRRADVLDALAVALAANGQFEAAVQAAEQAAIVAARTGQTQLEAAIRARQKRFAAGKAYIDPGPGR